MVSRCLIYLLASFLLLATVVSSIDEEIFSEVAVYANAPRKATLAPATAPPKAPLKPPVIVKAPAPAPAPGPMAPPPTLPPVNITECPRLCGVRCSLHSRKRQCTRVCMTCCQRCKCVPPGTYGNKEMCGKCYTDMTTHGNKPKCP